MEENEVTLKEAVEPKLIALDPQQFEIEINVSATDKEKIVAARLRAPLADEDFRFAEKLSTEFREATDKEDEIVVDDERASVELFNTCVTALKGFVVKGEDPEKAKDWRADVELLKPLIPHTWKAAFVRGMRISGAKFIEDEGDFVTLGAGNTLDVELIVGYEESPLGKVRFGIPEPSETERIQFTDRAMKFLQGRGRKRSSRVVTNLRVCAEFFDTLMTRPSARIEGGTVGGKTFDSVSSAVSAKVFIAQINPVYKAKVINAAMLKYNARLQD